VTRLFPIGSVVFLALMMLFPAAVAAQGSSQERGVLVGVSEDLTLNATASAAVVVGVQGNLTISGHARLVVMVDGAVALDGPAASVETLVAVRATVTLGPGTTVGTIRYLDSTITQDPTATVGSREDLQGSAFVLIGVLGTFLVLIYLGWAVAVLVAGAVMAAIAASQTRRMARSVSDEPLKVLGAGLVGLIVPLILAALLFVTVIGIPLGVMVFGVLWLMAFVGFLVMGVWLGDLLLRRGRSPDDGRPIGSAVLGLLLLLIASVIPLVALFVGWFGLGTVTLNAWRSLRGSGPFGTPAAVGSGGEWSSQRPGWGEPPGFPQPQHGQAPPGWGQPAPPAGPPPGWGQPAPPAGPPPAGPPAGWGQPAPPAGPPPAGPPAGWGQPPSQGR